MALRDQGELAESLLARDWETIIRDSNSNKVIALLRLLDEWLLTGQKVVIIVNNSRFLEILEVRRPPRLCYPVS